MDSRGHGLMTSKIDIFMYSALVFFSLYTWWVEKKDSQCPSLTSISEECESQGGMSYAGSKPSSTDSYPVLLQKIDKASEASTHAIHWRRALVLSTGCAVLTWVFLMLPVHHKLPSWQLGYLFVGILFVVMYGNLEYYSYHVYQRAERWTKEATELLSQRG